MSIPVYRGQAIPVIALAPDWVNPVRFGLEYSTTVSEALDTSEERQARFLRPLYRLDYTTIGLSAAQTACLRSVIETADDLPVACPLWPLAVTLSAAVAAGATTLTLTDARDCLFDVFHEFALVWESFDKWEIAELMSVMPESARLLVPLQKGYSSDALFIPLAYGFVPRGPVTQVTDINGRWQCRFEERFHRLHDQSIPETGALDLFDPTACAVTGLTNGGGDTFDCYNEGSAEELRFAGTGWAETWCVIESPFGVVMGDSFESYAATNSAEVAALESGSGFEGGWRVNTVASNELEVIGATHFVWGTTASFTFTIPAAKVAKAVILVLVRRVGVASGLAEAGWTLIKSQLAAPPNNWQATDIWMKTGTFPDSVTVTMAASSQVAYGVLAIFAREGVSVVLEGSASGTSTVQNHPIPSLVAAGDGRLGIVASGCGFAFIAGGTGYAVASPFTQITEPSVADNRLCIGFRLLSSGQNINATTNACVHSVSGTHNGAEVSVILAPA